MESKVRIYLEFPTSSTLIYTCVKINDRISLKYSELFSRYFHVEFVKNIRRLSIFLQVIIWLYYFYVEYIILNNVGLNTNITNSEILHQFYKNYK